MPNRIIKESIRTSKSINALTDFQFRLWTYLITYVDDYGRGSADPELLKGFVFPRRKGVTESNIKAGLTDLACAGLVNLYEVDGEPYLCFPTWAEHQRIQNKKSKFPEPPEIKRDQQKSTVTHRESPPESNPNPNPNPNPKKKETRTPRGKYGWVKLSDKEYERLLTDLGEEELARCIDYVDESAQGTGNKNGWKDWNVTVRRCHRDGWGIRPGSKAPAPKPSTQPSKESVMKCNAWIDEFLERNGGLG